MADQPEPRVSEEDREKAALAIRPDVQGAGYEYPSIDGARGAIDRLVDQLGWGPRPTVSPSKLDEFIAAAHGGGMATVAIGLSNYLRECGIEVTE